MISKRKRDFDSLARAAKTAGLIGLGEVTDFGTSTALGIAKTMQESTWEKKVLIGGILGNMAAGLLDMDLPFVNLGIESMQGIDAFVDNVSDVAMGVAGASLAYKTANNIQAIHNSEKSFEEILQEMGLDLDEEEQKPIKNNITNIFAGMSPEQISAIFQNKQNIKPIQEEKELNEDEEKAMLKMLLKKYGNNLTEEKL